MMLLAPELLYRSGVFERGMVIEISDDGTISRVAQRAEFGDARITELRGRAVLPGFVNAHSHSFQRLIRGRTQWRPTGPSSSDFWSWRASMYSAALTIGPAALYDVTRLCYMEMLKAGYTTVGEFHYLQRDPAGGAYADANELARCIIAAAQSVGIRIALINVCYATGAIGEALWAEQRRFATPDLDAFLDATEALHAEAVSSPTVTTGIAPHSIRAVPRDWLQPIHGWALQHDVPLHMHVAEQPAEVSACMEIFRLRPAELLAEDGLLDDRFTAIHATHLNDAEVSAFGRARSSICLCPTTERDLGDGLARIVDLVAAGASLCVGTDSQSVIDPLEEVRLIEYNERLRLLRRVVLSDRYGNPDRRETSPLLLAAGSAGGARSLRINAGAIEAGRVADFVAIDLDHPALVGWDVDTLAELLTLSAPAAAVCDVWVNGVQRIANGRHASESEIMDAYRETARVTG